MLTDQELEEYRVQYRRVYNRLQGWRDSGEPWDSEGVYLYQFHGVKWDNLTSGVQNFIDENWSLIPAIFTYVFELELRDGEGNLLKPAIRGNHPLYEDQLIHVNGQEVSQIEHSQQRLTELLTNLNDVIVGGG
jgi:hypothetical protein